MLQFKKEKKLSREAICILILTVAFDLLVYFGTKLISASWYHHDMTLPQDAIVPFQPWTVSIYFGSYILWFLSYWFFIYQSPRERNRFFLADTIGKFVCLGCFLLVPSTNVRPAVTGTGFWDFLMRLLYAVDRPDNLFPSIHCLASWLCWASVQRNKFVPAFIRWLLLVMAVLICLSTLTTRQHVMVDVFSGVTLAEICWWLSDRKKLSKAYETAIRAIVKLFSRKP